MANPKCLPRLPWPKWAEDAKLPQGFKSTDNWHAFERWAQLLLDECITGSCDPMAVRAHVVLGCGGIEYLLSTGDYEMGGATVGVDGLHLPAAGVWHCGFNMAGDVNTGSHVGQGILTVTNSDTCDYDYGIAVGNEDDTVATHVAGSGAVDHMVPPSFTAVVSVSGTGSSDGIFPSGVVGVVYAHRIECTDVLAETYTCT